MKHLNVGEVLEIETDERPALRLGRLTSGTACRENAGLPRVRYLSGGRSHHPELAIGCGLSDSVVSEGDGGQ